MSELPVPKPVVPNGSDDSQSAEVFPPDPAVPKPHVFRSGTLVRRLAYRFISLFGSDQDEQRLRNRQCVSSLNAAVVPQHLDDIGHYRPTEH